MLSFHFNYLFSVKLIAIPILATMSLGLSCLSVVPACFICNGCSNRMDKKPLYIGMVTLQIITGTCSKIGENNTFESKTGCKDQESIQSSTTPDQGYQWESYKIIVRHHKREPRGQPFPSR